MIVALVAVAALGPAAGTAAADADPNWWQSRSAEERQAIVNHYYGAAGHQMPYSAQAELATASITHLRETTPDGSRSRLATQIAKDSSKSGLLPKPPKWVPKLFKGAGAGGLLALVAITLEDTSKRLYASWSADVSDPPEGRIVVQGVWYLEDFDIYNGARSRPGEWLLNGTIDGTWYSHAMRWFQPPCTFSGLPTPPGAQLRTGVGTTSALCRYPTDTSPYYADAPVYVNYPYLTEDDLKLSDYPVIGPTGSQQPDYSVQRLPTPDPVQVEPLLEDLLEDGAHDDLRHRLLVAVATERILQNNENAVTSGDLDTDRARKIADACVTQAAATPGMTSADCGRPDLPMFVAGRLDYPEATDHIIRALEYYPPWFKLRYYQRPRSERDWKLGYPETDPPEPKPPFCKGTDPLPLPSATQCDEVPFLATEQGTDKDMAGNQRPGPQIPHLKIIDGAHNAGSGGKYGHFVSVNGCAMQARRDSPAHGSGNFLLLPVPSGVVPTLGFCNGPNPGT